VWLKIASVSVGLAGSSFLEVGKTRICAHFPADEDFYASIFLFMKVNLWDFSSIKVFILHR
jgi:hypothetical protein